MSTKTFGYVIEQALRYLQPKVGMGVPLTADYDSGATSITLDYTQPTFASVRPGALIAVDLEMLYVESVDTSTGVATVIPGMQGSTEADHTDGAVAWVNPRFSRFDIAQAVNDEIMSLSAPDNGLGQVMAPILLTYIPTFAGYDLGDTFDGRASKVLEVSYKIAPPVRTYPLIRRGDYRVIRNQSTTQSDFPSGNGIILYKSAYPGLPVNVTTLGPFVTLTNLTDDLLTVGGIPATAQDIVVMGAEIRLAPDREISRNSTGSQPDPRKNPEVPAGAMQQATNKLEIRRQRRIDEERSYINRNWRQAEYL